MQTPSTPPAPPAPAAPPSPAPALAGGVPNLPLRPLSAQEMSILRARRTELSNQLQSADGRRERLIRELESADGAARPGLEQRLTVLDRRIVQIETDIAENGRQLAAAAVVDAGRSPRASATTAPPRSFPGISPDQATALTSLFTLTVLAPLALSAARLMWKRATVPSRLPTGDTRTAERLGHLEQAVDAIAVEIERVSEGQRFVTRLLSEAHSVPALGAGQPAAEPIRVREGQAVRVPRSDG